MDSLSISMLFLGTFALVIGSIELGYQIGDAAHRKSDQEKESPVSAIAGTVLALLAFILAFTFSIVSDRFDARKALVRDQAVTIRTAYARADFLPEADRAESRALLDQYIALLISAGESDNLDEVPDLIAQANAVQHQLWTIAVANARLDMNSDVAALYIESLNSMNEIQATRVAVSVQARMPTGLWVVLGMLVALGMIAVGYQTAIAASRRSLAMLILAISFSVVITLIAALDNPKSGYLPVSQQPLTDLQTWATVFAVPQP